VNIDLADLQNIIRKDSNNNVLLSTSTYNNGSPTINLNNLSQDLMNMVMAIDAMERTFNTTTPPFVEKLEKRIEYLEDKIEKLEFLLGEN
jgi:Na+/phosphate symporter